jgi:hypothetical protein
MIYLLVILICFSAAQEQFTNDDIADFVDSFYHNAFDLDVETHGCISNADESM